VDALLTGANPNLFYLSLALICGGLILNWFLQWMAASAIHGKIAAAVSTREEESRAARSAMQSRGVRSSLLLSGGGDFGRVRRRIDATNKAVEESSGQVALAAMGIYACRAVSIVGVVLAVVYLVQRYGVV